MSKFNRKPTTAAAAHAAGVPLPPLAPAADVAVPQHLNHEGAPGFLRTTEGELFMLAVVNMVGEDTFYEKADARDTRYADLVRKVAVTNPEWLVGFIGWLRRDANMRSASGVAAVEMVMARKEAKLPGYGRQAVAAACARADEPAEILAYWLNRYAPNGGKGSKSMPAALRRGLADAVAKLYTERNFIKYDSDKAAVRMGDVVDLVRPTTHRPELRGTWQGDLLEYAIGVRHNRENLEIPASLKMLRARRRLLSVPADTRRAMLRVEAESGNLADVLSRAGMTWEQMAGWLPGGMDAEAWQWCLPQMGYMATLRNLRNLDKAGVPDDVADAVAAMLADPANVAKSRQFPYRFLSAYLATDTDRWRPALEKALQASVANIPALPGRTLVLVDTSGSMGGFISHLSGSYRTQTGVAFSGTSQMTPMMQGALFGVALAAKGENVELRGFANGYNPFLHEVRQGAGVLRATEAFCKRVGEDGHGTAIAESVRKTYKGHDRVVIITDMQTFGGDYYGVGPVGEQVPANIPMYAFNLGGYRVTGIDTSKPNRYELGGLTDATFKVMSLLETGEDAIRALGQTQAVEA